MEYTICTAIKNEHRYIKEWIDYHLSIGFNAIHLFEDYDSESHKEFLSEYDNVFIHSLKDCPRTDYKNGDYKQVDMMQYFINTYKDKYDYVAFIDVDEYIRFKDGYDLVSLCNEFNSYDAIYLQWNIIGANGHIKRPEGRIQDNYFGCAEWDNPKYCFKSLCNLKHNPEISHCHKIKRGVFTNHKNARRGPHKLKAYIDHYFTKSWEDWVARLDRGDVVDGNRKIEEFFRYNRGFDLNLFVPYVIGLNLGCGKNRLKNWFNTDLKDELFPIDATKLLPFNDESFEYVYSEHMVEHLAEEDGHKLFEEIYRVLRPNGVFRLALPTQEMFERITAGYLNWHFDQFNPNAPRTKEQLIIDFKTMWGHQKIYSVHELIQILNEIGFKVKQCEIGESEHTPLRNIERHGDIIGDYNNRIETTIIEATK